MGFVLFNNLDLFAESFVGGKEAGETMFFVRPSFPDLRVRLLFLFGHFLVTLLVPFRFASGIDLGNWIGQVDGEVIGTLPVTFRIAPQGLKVFAPAG